MRIIVCGSRSFSDKEVVNDILTGYKTVEEGDLLVVDGVCPYGGADQLAYDWAFENGIDTERFPPEFQGREAYLRRDREMVDSGADLLIAFVDKPLEKSRGTAYTVAYARTRGIKTLVVEVQ